MSIGGCNCDCGSHSGGTPNGETEKVQLQVLLQQHAIGSRVNSIRTKTRVVRIAHTADREESTEEAVHFDDEDDVSVIINSSTTGGGGVGVIDVDDDGSQNATLI